MIKAPVRHKQNRGNGYASTLILEVCRRLESANAAAHGAVLFSDVPAHVYEICGFVLRPCLSRVFAPVCGSAASVVDRLVGEHDLAEALEHAPLPSDDFVVWPSAMQLHWHLERERAYADLLRLPRPAACGARVDDSLAIWSADSKYEQLVVHFFHASTAERAARLIDAACRVASACGLRRVVMWESPVDFSWDALPNPGTREDRAPVNESMPMIRTFHPELQPQRWRHIMHGLWV